MFELKDNCLPVSEIPDRFCTDLEFLFTDIDDTITTRGMMPFKTLQNIYSLGEKGINVVLVTGRPAGWCDYFARMWPVMGVVGENGAFYFSYDRKAKKMKRVFLVDDESRHKNKTKLENIKKRVLVEVPGCRISADQSFRIADLAIDISEDVEPLTKDQIKSICRIIEEEKAQYKVSSIHINCWYGNYDKLACFKKFIGDYTGLSMEVYQNKMIYVGDSPNDEPMFEGFKYSAAVSNIKKYLPTLKRKPLYLTEKEGAEGFSELVKTILKKRSVYL